MFSESPRARSWKQPLTRTALGHQFDWDATNYSDVVPSAELKSGSEGGKVDELPQVGRETKRFLLRVVCDGVLRTQQRADVIIAKHFSGTYGVSRVLAE